VPLLLRLGDNVSTDEITPAGAEGMSVWSSLPGMAEHTFRPLDPSYVQRARHTGDHAVIGGRNYGQGSSREQAALAPRSLGLRLVIARSIARIHAENLVNFGILPLTTRDAGDDGKLQPGTTIRLSGLHQALRDSPGELDVQVDGDTIRCQHALSPRQAEVLFAGGSIPWKRRQLSQAGT
jgi:aconitate hydratase